MTKFNSGTGPMKLEAHIRGILAVLLHCTIMVNTKFKNVSSTELFSRIPQKILSQGTILPKHITDSEP